MKRLIETYYVQNREELVYLTINFIHIYLTHCFVSYLMNE